MHTLYLLRHAKSSWSDPALPDQERPLTERGRRDARRISEHLLQLGIKPELVLCSTAERTRETLELLRPAFAATTTVRLEGELYAAPADALLDHLRTVRDEVSSVMLIGHNPGLQGLALTLAATGSELERLKEKFPTAAFATLTVAHEHWRRLSPGEAVLAAYVVPRQLS